MTPRPDTTGSEGAKTYRTYRFRVRSVADCRELDRLARAVNFVWNFCGETQENARRWGKCWPSAFDLEKLTAGSSVLLRLHAGSIGPVCQRFALAREAARRRPRWRSKRSLGWVPFKGRYVRLGEGSVRFFGRDYRVWMSRPIQGMIKHGSFSQDARGRWYCNLTAEVEANAACGSVEVGIDLGLKSLATLSDGSVVENERPLLALADKLAKAQRAGRKRRAVAIHAKIQNKRRHNLHVASTTIVRRYGRIVVGGVSSARLTKTRFAKSVLDASWSTFRQMLRYKAIAHGAEYVEVDEANTTRTCSACSARSGPQGIAGLGVREWACEACGAVHDRDVNAAQNILLLGRSPGLQLTGIAA